MCIPHVRFYLPCSHKQIANPHRPVRSFSSGKKPATRTRRGLRLGEGCSAGVDRPGTRTRRVCGRICFDRENRRIVRALHPLCDTRSRRRGDRSNCCRSHHCTSRCVAHVAPTDEVGFGRWRVYVYSTFLRSPAITSFGGLQIEKIVCRDRPARQITDHPDHSPAWTNYTATVSTHLRPITGDASRAQTRSKLRVINPLVLHPRTDSHALNVHDMHISNNSKCSFRAMEGAIFLCIMRT